MRETLFIYPSNEIKLPGEYHFSHNVSVRLYDDLVWLLKDSKTQKKAHVKVEFKNEKDTLDENEEDVIQWLIDHGYKTEADEVVSNNLTLALVSDICHFIYQALDSAKNMKLTVAFTLLRKPFLENLSIIEQLLDNQQDFLDRFEKQPSQFDPGKLSPEQKKKIIASCILKLNSNLILTPDLIYELRWEKSNANSLYANSNLATHLVTTRNSSYRTTSQNMNFIFSGYEQWESQLDYIYLWTPYLLYYLVEIVDQLLYQKKIITKEKLKERKFLRLIGQMLLEDQYDEKSAKGKSIVNTFSKILKFKCLACNKQNQVFKSDLFTLIHDDYLLCKHCLLDSKSETNSLKQLINAVIKI